MYFISVSLSADKKYSYLKLDTPKTADKLIPDGGPQKLPNVSRDRLLRGKIQF